MHADHVHDAKVGGKFSVVRRILLSLLQSAEELLHERKRAFDFLRIARKRILSLRVRICLHFCIGSFRVVHKQDAHVVDNRTDPFSIHIVPHTDLLEALEALRKCAKNFTFDPRRIPRRLLTQQLGLDKELN